MKLKALKTFSAGGAKLTYQGTEFEAAKDRAQEYINLGLAEEVVVHDPTEPSPEQENTPTVAPENLTTEFAGEVAPNIRADDEPAKEVMAQIEDYSDEELMSYNMTKLKEVAKNLGVVGTSNMPKSDLVFAIKASLKSQEV